jgi:hypothetical protein
VGVGGVPTLSPGMAGWIPPEWDHQVLLPLSASQLGRVLRICGCAKHELELMYSAGRLGWWNHVWARWQRGETNQPRFNENEGGNASGHTQAYQLPLSRSMTRPRNSPAAAVNGTQPATRK